MSDTTEKREEQASSEQDDEQPSSEQDDEQPSSEQDDEQASSDQDDKRSEAEKADQAQEKHVAAKEKMAEIEEMDEPPAKLEDWPDDQAKYITYGGAEGGDHSYGEGPEAKLGPSGLERRADGSILIDGEKVDNPDDYKGEPIPGGPTDPNAPKLPGEVKKSEKREKTEGGDG